MLLGVGDAARGGAGDGDGARPDDATELELVCAERDELARRLDELTSSRLHRLLARCRRVLGGGIRFGPRRPAVLPVSPVEPEIEPSLPVESGAAGDVETEPLVPLEVVAPDEATPSALVIDARHPTPDRDAGSRYTTGIVEALEDLGHRVAFLADDGAATPDPDLVFGEVHVVHHPIDVLALLRQWSATLEVVVLCRGSVAARHLALVRTSVPDATVVFSPHDLVFLREGRRAELEPVSARLVDAHREIELGNVRASDVTIVPSTHELALLRELCPEARVHLVPIRETPRATEADHCPDGRSGIVFVGGFAHAPNVDAVHWLVDEIMPKVWEVTPDATVDVIGADPPPDLESVDERVRIRGWVPDLAAEYDGARVVVAPLRFGAGAKGKISEAMAAGVPVVTTTVGAEGMGIVPGDHAIVADGERPFAQAVVQLFDDDGLWTHLAARAAEQVAVHHGAEAVRDALAAAIDDAPGRSPRPD